MLNEHESEWLKGICPETPHRFHGCTERVGSECVRNQQPAARDGARVGWRLRRVPIQHGRDEPGVVDANPRAAADRIDRHDGGTAAEHLHAWLKSSGTIA